MRARKAGFIDEMQATGEGAKRELWHLVRSVPTTVGSTVEIGRFESTSHATTVNITLAMEGTSLSRGKHYIVALQHDTFSGAWRQLSPVSVNSYSATNDAELDIRIESSVFYLRLRRTVGTASGTASLLLQSLNGLRRFDFIESSASGSGATVVGSYPKWLDATYGSGWTDYHASYNGAQYRREGSRVFLRGIMNCAAAWTSYTTMLTLPEMYRPASRHFFLTLGNSNESVRVDIYPDGTMIYHGGGANTGWVTLDNINFSVDP